jgi:hypothetical protein
MLAPLLCSFQIGPKAKKRQGSLSKSRSAACQKKVKLDATKTRWTEAFIHMDTDMEGFGGGTGRAHSYQENSLILLAVRLVLGIWLDCCEQAS